MLRLVRKAIPVALAFALFAHTDAFAATVPVSETNFLFTPGLAKIKLGDSVQWTNNSASAHTATGDAPLSLWDSGNMNQGATYSYTFTAAGIYSYNCVYHFFQGMTGQVGLKDRVNPPQGPVGTMFTVTVATVVAPAGYVYDVQKKNPGGSFQDWKIGITTVSTVFDSTGQATGTYQFRSRLRRTADGAASGYSPGQNLRVNP